MLTEHRPQRSTFIALCLLLLAVPAWSQAQSQPPPQNQTPVARVTDLTGVVTARHGDAWNLLNRTPADLYDGDKVNTDRGRATILFLNDDSTLVLDVGTNITIHQAPGSGGTISRRIAIFLGDVWFKMTKTPTQNTVLVTPTAVGGLRGTEGNVHVESETESSFTLNDGELAIAKREPDGSLTRNFQPVRLRAGETLGAVHGQQFVARRALARVERPDVKLAAEKLPQLRADRQAHLRMAERPHGVPGAGLGPRQQLRQEQRQQMLQQRQQERQGRLGQRKGAEPAGRNDLAQPNPAVTQPASKTAVPASKAEGEKVGTSPEKPVNAVPPEKTVPEKTATPVTPPPAAKTPAAKEPAKTKTKKGEKLAGKRK